MILEAPIDNFNIAQQMVKKGVNRLEICRDLYHDGLTPTKDLFIECKRLNVVNFVMIRPYKGDFTVCDNSFNLMKKEIEEFKDLGADGFVLGILKNNNEIDIDKIKELVKLTDPLPITFHKAIDVTSNILDNIRALLHTGVKRVLTSGGKPTVIEGIDTIKKMHEIVKGKITLVAGGKVTYNNLSIITKELPFCEYHGRQIVKI